ncbi:MAG: phosphoribosyltransferase family protein [Patescibacteria group bacterium]|jgi:amidophosphoribosyltransferase
MCGVVGIIGRDQVISRLVQAAGRLQNRGDRSTRAVTFCQGRLFEIGAVAPPEVAYFNINYQDFPGRLGIAHTRYATTGSDDLASLQRNIQPYIGQGTAICGNGDLISSVSLRKKLFHSDGKIFQTQLDIEITDELLSREMRQRRVAQTRSHDKYAKKLFAAVEAVNKQQVGAWSNLVLLPRGLLAFRDPAGIRPLTMAKRYKDGVLREVMFASETSVFHAFGTDYCEIEEISPGEMVFVSSAPHLKVYRHKPESVDTSAFCFFEYIYFARPDSAFKKQVVEVVRERLGQTLANEYKEKFAGKIDVVIGIPASALSAAAQFAHELSVPFKVGAVIKVGNKRSFQETSQEKRKRAIQDKFLFLKQFVKGKRVAVVDDSNVRGNTAKKIIEALLSLEAKEVHYFFFSPPIIGSCFYGIDTPDARHLIAHRHGSDPIKIAEEMKATSVNYVSMAGLLQALDVPEKELCLGCITKRYPTSVTEAENRVAERLKQRRHGTCGAMKS